MRSFIVIFIISFSSFCFSQNWNVFNKNYRYNYKYNNSQLISNVMFVDTIKIVGTDTIYSMNRIGVVTGSILTTNKPQFLQRNIRKYSNGLVKLYDTTKVMIIPTCTLNQTWLFDSIYNLNATCIATATQNIFSIIDSVKTILVNSIDTLVLSKQFGVTQFPKLYGQNKYYRLVGIEDAAKYDSIPLFGNKVPNAWDFYNFKVGDEWCTANSFLQVDNQLTERCAITTVIVRSKTVTPTGYIYNIDEKSITSNHDQYCNPYATASFTNMNVTYSSLDSKQLLENKMYPGMVDFQYSIRVNLVKFGLDNQGTFYKYYGPTCSSINGKIMPHQNEPGSFGQLGPPYTVTYILSSDIYALTYGVGLGLINQNKDFFEYESDFCMNCYGTVNLGENNLTHNNKLFYPNPANTDLKIDLLEITRMKIFNFLGTLIIEKDIQYNTPTDISSLSNGIYLIELENDSFKSTQKLIVEH